MLDFRSSRECFSSSAYLWALSFVTHCSTFVYTHALAIQNGCTVNYAFEPLDSFVHILISMQLRRDTLYDVHCDHSGLRKITPSNITVSHRSICSTKQGPIQALTSLTIESHEYLIESGTRVVHRNGSVDHEDIKPLSVTATQLQTNKITSGPQQN